MIWTTTALHNTDYHCTEWYRPPLHCMIQIITALYNTHFQTTTALYDRDHHCTVWYRPLLHLWYRSPVLCMIQTTTALYFLFKWWKCGLFQGVYHTLNQDHWGPTCEYGNCPFKIHIHMFLSGNLLASTKDYWFFPKKNSLNLGIYFFYKETFIYNIHLEEPKKQNLVAFFVCF